MEKESSETRIASGVAVSFSQVGPYPHKFPGKERSLGQARAKEDRSILASRSEGSRTDSPGKPSIVRSWKLAGPTLANTQIGDFLRIPEVRRHKAGFIQPPLYHLPKKGLEPGERRWIIQPPRFSV